MCTCACVHSLCSCSLGSMIERILVSCSSQQDLHEWVEHLQKQTKVTSVSNPPIKPHSVPSHTVRLHDFFSCSHSNGLCWGCQWMQHSKPWPPAPVGVITEQAAPGTGCPLYSPAQCCLELLQRVPTHPRSHWPWH